MGAAVAQPPPHPKVLLLLASGLSLDDLQGRLPHVRQLAEAGGAALLNTATSGTRTESAAYLSVGASERLGAPDEALAAQVRSPEENDLEGDSARNVYRRRFGVPPPQDAGLLHLGLPALAQVQPSPSRAAQIGALGEALRNAGFQAATDGDPRSVLVVMDRRGTAAHVPVPRQPDEKQVAAMLAQADVMAITAQDAESLDHLAKTALPLSQRHYVIAAIPAAVPGRLGVITAAGPGIAGHSILLSPTTRTPGLAANIDIAPTVLKWLGMAIPTGMGGQPITTGRPSGNALDTLALLDRQVVATRNATVPVLIGYGIFAIGTCLLALMTLLLPGWANRARAVHGGLLLAAAALVGFLPVGVWAPPSPWLYGAAVVGVSGLLVLAAIGVGRRLHYPTLGVLLTATAIVVIIDTFFGSVLVSRALLSGYFLPGLRFYGVGNEYMGLTVGAALVGPLLAPFTGNEGTASSPAASSSLPPRRREERSDWAVRVLWLTILLAIGAPYWGADAGGAITATLTFGVAFFALRTPQLRTRHIVAAFAAAILVVAAFTALDRARPAENRSHVGAAVAAGQARGPAVLVEIAARKAAMNIGLLLTPGAAAALAGLVPIWWLLGRGPLLGQAVSALERRPRLRRVLPAAAWGALAAFIFNDSGIAAALLLLAAPTVAVIDGILCDFSGWTTEHDASALPSAMH